MISVFIRNTSTDDQYEIPYQTIQIDEELNVGRSCRLVLDYRAIDDIARVYGTTVEFILSGGIRELTIKKNSTNIYIGVVSDFSLTRSVTDGLQLSIASISYFSILRKRRTIAKRAFVSTDAGQIAWTLIDESQQFDLPYSDFGITQGTITPSVDRDVTYRFANIQTEITQLSNKNLLNGFDFDIDNNKVFNVFYPIKGMNRPDIFLDESNIQSWGLRKPLATSLTNYVYAIGSGFNDDVIYTTRQSPNSYKSSFGLLQDILSRRDISTTPFLDDAGDKYLLDNQAPQVGINIAHLDNRPDLLDYELGDSVRVTIPELSLLQSYKRIYKRSMRIDITQTPTITVEVK